MGLEGSTLFTHTMASNDCFECNSPDVVFENFGDEIVVLNLQSGNYYSLDPIGMFYWDCLSQSVPPADIAAHICQFYAGSVEAEPIADDLDALCSEFQSEGLVRSSNTRRSLAEVNPTTAKFPAVYACPILSRFDDFAEMLLLDPVHDVGEAGWPHPVPVDPSTAKLPSAANLKDAGEPE